MDNEVKKKEILNQLSTDFIDDYEFLEKVNRLSFGLMLQNDKHPRKIGNNDNDDVFNGNRI